MELLGKDLKTLYKKCDLGCVNGDLTGLCTENISLDTVNVADIGLLEICVIVFTDSIASNVYLNVAL